MKRSLAITLLCAATLPAVAQPAPAEPRTAEEHYEQSKKLYNIEKYDEAIAELKKAYELSPEPVYLFNIAQALRKKNDCAGALDYYRKYLRDDPDASNKAKVEQWMVEMETCAKTQKPVETKPVETKPVDTKPVDTKPVDTKPVDAKPTTTGMAVIEPKQIDTPQPTDSKRMLRIAGIATAGVGIGVVGLGTAMALSARGIANGITERCQVDCDWAIEEKNDDKGRSRATLSKIAFGVGGVAIVGGVAMYILGRSTGREARVAVVPADGGGFVVTGGRF